MKIFIIIIFSFFLGIKPVNGISASSYIVMDMETQNVLFGENLHSSRLIASISKIMTCIIAIENANLDVVVTVDDSILSAVGSSIYIERGEKIKLKDLLYGLMLRSGNDAAMLIANEVSGDMNKFSKLMNEYAKKLGMKNTYFYNSHGLENKDGNGNTSTAYDMALLTSYAMKNKTFRTIFKTKNYVAKSDRKNYTWLNKNKLLKYDYVTGGKTGYTQKAKRTLVTTARVNDINVVVVTLNDGNDWNDHVTLYKMVKDKYIKKKIISKKDFEIIDDTIYSNDTLYIKNDVKVTIFKQNSNNLKIKYYLIKNINPIDNQKIGSVKVYDKNNLLHESDIYIKLSKNKKKNFLEKLFQKIFKS